MKNLDQLLENYSRCHKHPVNELIHLIAVPLIMFSILGLLFSVNTFLALVISFLCLFFYLQLSLFVFLLMLVWTILNFIIIYFLKLHILKISFALFCFGWVFQFVGHFIEGKKPSFFEDIKYFLVGPLFVLDCIFLKLRIRKRGIKEGLYRSGT